MRVLVLGSGAREHALAWRLAQSRRVTSLLAAPGNPGIAALCECVAVDPLSPTAVVALARQRSIELVVVGPEAPLVAGVADALVAAGIPVFGPSAASAKIEGSKAFAKEVMLAAGVPTARHETFEDPEAAARRVASFGPVVVKADGLAAGKGVVVAASAAEAAAACRSLGTLPAGKRVLLEERLEGPELSVIALCDGVRYALLPPAQDHKRLLDHDLGPNTGGMGAWAPASLLSADQLDEVGRTVIAPTLAELVRRGTPFRGALFAGLMLTARGPMVLEFNCRLGDPETQPLMMLLDEDLGELLLGCATGQLERARLRTRPGVALGVVLAARGYPEAPVSGDRIDGLDALSKPGADVELAVFHAGTRREQGALVTSGGRVLTVCARAAAFGAAQAAVYAAVDRIAFEGKQVRRDIGAQARG